MERKKMKKLRKAVSLVAVMAIMATMFAAPLGVNAADENIAYTYSGKISPGSSNGAPSTFSKFTGESVTAENGTLKTPKEYYYTGKNLYGGAGDMTVGYVSNGSDGGKSVITFNDLYSDFVKDADSNTRIVYEININPIKQINNITLMMRDAGVSITKSLVTNFDYGKWTNIKIYYNPTVKYKYTKTTGTTSEIKEVTTNSLTNFLIANNTSSATNINNYWKGLLGSEYDENSSYAFNSATYGDCDVYVNGIYKGNISGLTNSSNPRHVSATIPGRISFNAASTALFYSNASVKVIKNCTPSASAMSPFTNESKDGKYVSDTNNIYIKEGTSLSDITLNDGYEMAAYTDMTAGGTYPTVPADGVLANGNTIMVRDKNTYQMRGYTVKTSAYDTLYSYTGAEDLNGGDTKNFKYEKTAEGTYKITETGSGSWKPFVSETASAKEVQLKTFDGYVKVSFKIMPTNADSNSNFYIGTYQSANISGVVSFDMLNENEWNQIDLILNTTGKSTGSPSTLYINNTLTTATTSTAYLNSNADSHRVRFVLANVTATAPVYMDDITVTKEYLRPAGFVYTDDFKYSDNDFAIVTSFSPANMALVRFDANWKQSGIGGKSSSDRSLQVVKKINTTENASATNAYLQFNYKKDTEKYLIIKYNVFMPSGQGLKYNFIAENGHENLSPTMYLSEDVWHEITDIIEFVNDTTATYTTYVDGIVYGSGKTSADFAKGAAARNLRFDICGTANSAFKAYFDDFVIYRSNTAPTVAPQELTNTFDGDIKVADGNTMYIPAGATAAQAKAIIKDKYAAAAVKAINGYKVSGNTVLADDATLTDGDIIVYETTDNGVSNAGLKTYSYVTVKSLPSSGIIAEKSSVKATQAATAHAFTTESGYTFVAAEYDKDGSMVQVDYNTNSTISLTTKTAGNTVKLFLIDSFGNLKPLAENVEIAVK